MSSSRIVLAVLGLLMGAAAVGHGQGVAPGPADLAALRARFADPPKNAGTTTLWWLNGRLSREQIREQLRTLRDRDGFGGVAPLTLFRMKPSTQPAYLTDEYFQLYGYILDTAKELGMSVVFYDDCDFPSGTAGKRMAEQYPQDLMKYLARARATVAGPGDAVLPVPEGVLMSVVARNRQTSQRRVVTAEARLERARLSPLAGGSVGFRQPPEEESACHSFRVLDAAGRVLFEDRFDGKLAGRWRGIGGAHIAQGELHATDCMPMEVQGLALPEKFTIEAKLSIVRTAAGIAFGVKHADDLVFWQFNANTRSIRPHVRRGGYRTLTSAPFPFQPNRPYDVRIAVDGATVETWIDGKRVAVHKLEDSGAAVRWTAPAGDWEVQAFVCATAPGRMFVDCLDPQAMAKFIGLTYDRFAKQFPSHFGTTIRMTFYDDLSTYHVPECLAWTPSFNEKFLAKFGRSAESLYPALWEDIGPETAAARASLYDLRNELFAAGYPRAVEQWCAQRGMKCSGHPAASYRANPLQSPGDAILFYKYQGAPLTDYIHYYGHGVDGFKIPASAAYNYDRPEVVCEIYGNFHQKLPNDANMLYRAGMEVYARGINFLLPHGTWWDPAEMRIVPEISWRNPQIGPELPRYNRWAARCESLLRAGRHVADLGVLYPIDDLAARYHVGLLPFTHGKDPIPGTDYYELARLLTGEVRRDFTFLHPQTVDERCRVDGRELLLDNRVNWERYRVVILPACRTIRATNLKKIREFLAGGGRVIATTCLPERSAEFGRDAEVQQMAKEMFGPGGKGRFLPKPDEKSLLQALDDLGIAWDVRIDKATEIPRNVRKAHDYGGQLASDPDWYEGGNREFAYLHRSVPGAEVYFFTNASDLPVGAEVQLRGRLVLETWDPHTGTIRPLESTVAEDHGQPATRFPLSLAPIRSVFVVGRTPAH